MKSSYHSILRSSSIIGGGQLASIAISMVKVKIVALIVGPVGIGLVGTYVAMQQLITVLCGLGINQSAVREISQARGDGDEGSRDESVAVLHTTSYALGLIGTLIVLLFSKQLSVMTFGDSSHSTGIMWLGISVFAGIVTAAHRSVLQGFRKIREMTQATVLGALIGAILSIIAFYFLGLGGVIPSIVMTALSLMVAMVLFSRGLKSGGKIPSIGFLWNRFKRLLPLGLSFMWNGLLTSAVAYAIRLIITSQISIAAVGLYVAAYGITGMIVNFILQAMSGDYYPRLSQASASAPTMLQLVNEQQEIGVLLALPALTGLVVFAPWLVLILYTNEFMDAAPMIQLFALGCFLRVASWPMGYVTLALNRSRLFAVASTFGHVIHITMVGIFLKWMNVEGAAYAFVLFYSVWVCVEFIIAKNLINFSFNSTTFRLVGGCFIYILLSYLISTSLSNAGALIFGFCAFSGSIIIALRGLLLRVGKGNIPAGPLGRIILPLQRVFFPRLKSEH